MTVDTNPSGVGRRLYDKAGWVEADRLHLLHPQHHPSDHRDPIVWVGGDGVDLIDSDGNRVLDGLSGMWNVHLGHGRRELVAAASDQMSTLAFATSYAGSTHYAAISLAERLASLTPEGIEAFFFTSGGSDATDSSIRTARWYWRAVGQPAKQTIIARHLSYHGSSIGASSATGVAEFSDPFGPRLPGFVHIDPPYPYRGLSGSDAAEALERTILSLGAETVAAFIAEPVIGGGGGVIVPDDTYFPRVREICDRYGILLIADEVITGFGRTGRWFGLDHWGVRPDIVQFAKGITSGYLPLGGIGVSAAIKTVLDEAEPDRRWWHGLTNSAHPVSCRVALETLRIIDEEGLVERSAVLGQRLLDRLRDRLASHPHVGDIRGLGLLAGVELVADRDSKARFAADAGLAPRLRAAMLERGVVTRIVNDTVCLAPPLTIPETRLDQLADIVAQSVSALFPHPL
jgi:adenosylmethionine-8-amino-7-oxononanoate aminotransferase